MKDAKHKINPIVLGSSIAAAVLLIAYLGLSLYFTKHFYFRTVINGIKAAGKNVDQVEDQIAKQTENYTLELDGRDGNSENITSDDIDLKYVSDGKVDEIKKSQNGFCWIVSIFTSKNNDLEASVTYDKEKLSKKIDSLNCLNPNNVTNPQNAKVEFDGNSYVVKEEVIGNKILRNNLEEAIEDCIEKGVQALNIDQSGCYENPVYTKDSEEVQNAIEVMNNYSNSVINYKIGDNSEKVDASKISEWLYTDDNLEVQINRDEINKYVLSLAKKYNTMYGSRKFKTTSGNVITVSGGDYGWVIDKEKEADTLVENIKSGETTEREPVYSQTANQHGSNDYGNSYVEVNLSAQHLWVYVNGNITVESDFVSGNVSAGTPTPAGTYKLKYKERDTVLRGVGSNGEYASPVKYWMPFNGGIGLHDANWRSIFGGSEYLGNGSHGCVNLPVEKAGEIYNNVEAGMPVICYY